jgi:hypothetical protein
MKNSAHGFTDFFQDFQRQKGTPTSALPVVSFANRTRFHGQQKQENRPSIMRGGTLFSNFLETGPYARPYGPQGWKNMSKPPQPGETGQVS